MQSKFAIDYYPAVSSLILSLDETCRRGIYHVIDVSNRLDVRDPKLLKKLRGTDLWEYRKRCAAGLIRILAFIDNTGDD